MVGVKKKRREREEQNVRSQYNRGHEGDSNKTPASAGLARGEKTARSRGGAEKSAMLGCKVGGRKKKGGKNTGEYKCWNRKKKRGSGQR